ncbi:MAG: phytoene/squalene synthase family protein, partial [Halorubrum sp.]
MVEKTQVVRSKRIQRRTGKTFHVATRLLPKRIRHPTYVLYGFFRIADEVVDAEDTAPPPEQRAELNRLRRAALGTEPTDDPVLEAFAAVCEEHDISDADVHSFVDAMESDIDTDRYETY